MQRFKTFTPFVRSRRYLHKMYVLLHNYMFKYYNICVYSIMIKRFCVLLSIITINNNNIYTIHRFLSTIILTYLNICGILHFEIIGHYIFICFINAITSTHNMHQYINRRCHNEIIFSFNYIGLNFIQVFILNFFTYGHTILTFSCILRKNMLTIKLYFFSSDEI